MILELDCGNSLIKWRVLNAESCAGLAGGVVDSDEALLQALEGWEAPVALVDDRDYFTRHPTSRLHDVSIGDARLGELAAEHLGDQLG